MNVNRVNEGRRCAALRWLHALQSTANSLDLIYATNGAVNEAAAPQHNIVALKFSANICALAACAAATAHAAAAPEAAPSDVFVFVALESRACCALRARRSQGALCLHALRRCAAPPATNSSSTNESNQWVPIDRNHYVDEVALFCTVKLYLKEKIKIDLIF